tara:strand:+ start:12071 stop:17392 length:5322 start_codon:yes stop_codon:yes gene_type:complete
MQFLNLLSRTRLRTAALVAGALLIGTPVSTAAASTGPGTPTVQFNATNSAGGETNGPKLITVNLSASQPGDVTVPFTLSGDAQLGVDYTIDASPLVILAGSTSATITITPLGDPLHEGNEYAVLTMGTPTGANLGANTAHSFRINDDDAQPSVFLEVTEDIVSEDVGLIVVRVRLSAVSGLPTTVPFETIGQAIEGVDYIMPPSPAVIPAGANNTPLLITVLDDLIQEPDKTLGISIAAGGFTNATSGNPAVVAFVVEDDDVPAPPAISSLRPSTLELEFGDLVVGDISGSQRIRIQNTQPISILFGGVRRTGERPDQFRISHPQPLPYIMAPGQTTYVDVTFEPTLPGEHEATLLMRQSPHPGQILPLTVRGTARGVLGKDLLVHAGFDPYAGTGNQVWAADYGYGGSSTLAVSEVDVAGSLDDALFHVARQGSVFDYAFALPNGPYEVTLRFSEQDAIGSGARQFDVFAEGAPILSSFDIVAAAGAPDTAVAAGPFVVDVMDGTLNLDFVGVVGEAQFQALEVRAFADVSADLSMIEFGSVDQGSPAMQVITITNDGLLDGTINAIRLRQLPDNGVTSDYSLNLGGSDYAGGVSTLSYMVSEVVPAQSSILATLTFNPTEHADSMWSLHLEADFGEIAIVVSGTGGADPGWGFLHPVPDKDVVFLVDYDGTGTEDVQFRGSESHTHEPGKSLVSYDWELNSVPISSLDDPILTLPLGPSQLKLTIGDDNLPASTAFDTLDVVLHPVDGVAGSLKLYYDGSLGAGAVALLDAVPARADYIERGDTSLEVVVEAGKVGASPFTADTLVVMQFTFDSAAPETLEFVPVGGTDDRLFVDGMPASGPIALGAGTHTVEARFAVVTVADLPVRLDVLDGVGSPDPTFFDRMRHDETGRVPVIHTLPPEGLDLGGNVVTIEGFGFFPENDVTVHWGGTDLTELDFSNWTGESIEVTTPPGSGVIQVTVETSVGVSNAVNFTYSNTGPVPVNWTRLDSKFHAVAGGTCLAWGPDGKLYVGRINGRIRVIEFDQNYNVVAWTDHTGLQGMTNSDLLGITFNPYDTGAVKIYVSHGEHFLNGGGSFAGPSPYTGQVSMLTGPNFNSPVPIVTGLPTSNHDHAVNGIEFDDNGDLLICVGGNTNAGVAWPLIGDLPESPLSGAVLRARLSDPSFDGAITYELTASGVPTLDQVDGEVSDQVSGDVEVYASGLRNAYDMVLTTSGYLYATDNGPNNNYGPASLDAMTDGGSPQPSDLDELVLVEQTGYHGHPNRNRGRADERQNAYHASGAPTVVHQMSGALLTMDSSVNGITEYRATTFNSAIRGHLVAQKWNSPANIIELSPNGRAVVSSQLLLPIVKGLDVEIGPGGAILTADYSNGLVRMTVPNDVAVSGLTAYDIFPWRAPSGGGAQFTIGGVNFGGLGNTSVTIGGQAATLTSVNGGRIVGTLPPSPSGQATGLVDVVVTVGPDSKTIPAAFKWLAPAAGQGTGTWKSAASLPDALGEVSAELIDGTLYMVGEGSNKTYAYDVANDAWSDTLATRPFPGNHHACEVFDGKLYLIGGLGSGQGKVQIYDPVLNTWSLGADMPWSGGSCSSASIDGLIYVCGGIVGGGTVNNLSVYDPVLDQWQPGGGPAMPGMPVGVNHAGSSTDGEKLYIFGGRAGGNFPAPGFTNLQIYDPVLNTWEDSGQMASSLADLPAGRGGTGRAVHFAGKFYLFGGETSGGVFDEVFVYDVQDNSWSNEADMITARHGIFPVVVGHRIFCIGGGIVAGFSASDLNEFLLPR